MTTPLSMLARKARMTGLRDALDVGGGAALFYAGTPPETAEDETLEPLLATLPFAMPCGVIGESGALATLALTTPRLTNATASGVAGWVRFVDGAGNGFMDLPVGLVGSGAPVIVNALQFYTGGQVQLVSCVLAE